MATRPTSRKDFRVAVVCAIIVEFNAVSRLLDEHWGAEGDDYGRVQGDINVYTTGRINKHNVVLLCLADAGKASAASAAASLRSSYPQLALTLLVGICAGVPHAGSDREILLGDVVFARHIVQYDLGRQYPDTFQTKYDAEESLGRAPKSVRNMLTYLQTDLHLEALEKSTASILQKVQNLPRGSIYQYPGAAQDRLFSANYQHKHRGKPPCLECERAGMACEKSRKQTCLDIGCEDAYLVPRRRLQALQADIDPAPLSMPRIVFGRFGSADTVLKSGMNRQTLVDTHDLDAFEMEGAGIWDEGPCVIIKSVCDYADSHKNKEWHNYAAATAASAAAAFLQALPQTDGSDLRPTPHFLVPFGRNEDFVGRTETITQLLKRVSPQANKVTCQWTAIEGLGGVGKTQVALEVAYRVREDHPDCAVFWAPVLSMATFENAYRDIGKALQIQGKVDDKVDDIMALVKTTLENSETYWLLIIDNIDDVDLVSAGSPLVQWLPFSLKGSILFTTRNHRVTSHLDIPSNWIFKMEEMTDTEAMKMLRKGLKDNQLRDHESTKSLIQYLANLPLAIKQACAYMVENGTTTTEYLKYCRTSHEESMDLFRRDFRDRNRYTETRNPVATTWLISFQHVTHKNDLAVQYLKFISFLAEKDIPIALLPAMKNKRKVHEALATLKAYAFIIARKETDSFDMHRLVRLITRNWLRQERNECIATVLKQLSRVYPYPRHETRHVWMRYLPHAQMVIKDCGEYKEDMGTFLLMHNVGESYRVMGKYGEAERIYRQTLELKKSVLGEHHPDTLGSINNFALTLHQQGQYGEAEKINRQTLKLRESVLGQHHPDTLISMNNLALTLQQQGKYEEAEQIHRETLELRKSVLDEHHPDTLISMNNLASTFHQQGQYGEAEKIDRQTLKLRESVLGQCHPDTLVSMNNLASTLEKQGKYGEAEQIHRETLEVRESVLGEHHPDTLGSMNNLALTLQQQGKYREAEKIYRHTLELRESVLGEHHPDTLVSKNNLASIVQQQGIYGEAEQMHRKTLELRKSVLGQRHPGTLASMNNLAFVLQQQGIYGEAEQIHRKTLELRKFVLGQHHPDTLVSMNNLALTLGQQGQYGEAEQIHWQTLELRESVLGRDHPHTISSMDALAVTYYFQKRYDESEKLQEQALLNYGKVLGANHPCRIESMRNLADALRGQGKHVQAEAIYQRVNSLMEEVLGRDHPSTILTRSCLQACLTRAKDKTAMS